MKFSFKDFFSTCDQDQVDLLKKSVVENFNFCAVPHEIRSIKYCPGMSCLLNCPIKDIHLKTFLKNFLKEVQKRFPYFDSLISAVFYAVKNPAC